MNNIFLLSKNFPPLICGVGDYTFQLFTRLRNAGYDARVITGKNEEVQLFVSNNHLTEQVYPVVEKWDRTCIKTILDILQQTKGSILWIQYVPSGLSRIAFPFFLLPLLLKTRIRSIAVGIFFHEVSVRILRNGVKSFLRGSLQRLLAYLLYLFSNFAMTSSKIYSSYFRPFRISISPIPANIFGDDEFVPSANKQHTGPIKVVCFWNRCHPIVIRAVAKCIKEHQVSLKFIVAGKMTSRQIKTIEDEVNANGIAGSVEVFSETSGKSIADLFWKSDVFVHIESVSARGEGGVSSKSGIASAAMAAGLAMISTEGDMTDTTLYQHRKNILLIAKPSETTITDSIRELITDSKLRFTLRRNVAATYQQFFSWERTVELYISFFSENDRTNPS